MRLGATEIILIIILALVLFGGGKLAGIGKALGRSIKEEEDKKKQKQLEEEKEKVKAEEEKKINKSLNH